MTSFSHFCFLNFLLSNLSFSLFHACHMLISLRQLQLPKASCLLELYSLHAILRGFQAIHERQGHTLVE